MSRCLLLGSLCTLILVLVGCDWSGRQALLSPDQPTPSSGSNTPRPTETPTLTPIPIRLAQATTESLPPEFLTPYQASQQPTPVTVILTSLDTTTLFTATPAADLILADVNTLSLLAAQGQLLSWEKPPFDLSAAFGPTLTAAVTRNDLPFALPATVETMALYYNRELFATAGVPTPTRQWRWADLQTAAKRLHRPTDNVTGLVLCPDPVCFLPFVYQTGQAITITSEGAPVLNSPAFVTALQFYADLRLKDRVAALPEELNASHSDFAFAGGRVAMTLGTPQLADLLRQIAPHLQFGVSELPAGPGGPGNIAQVKAYAVLRASSAPAASQALAQYLTTSAYQRTLLLAGLALPPRPALLTEPYLERHPYRQPFLAALPYARPLAFGPKQDAILTALAKAIRVALQGELSPQAALDQAAAALQQ